MRLNQVTMTTKIAGATTIPANVTGTITSGNLLLVELDDGGVFQPRRRAHRIVQHRIILTDALPSQLSASGIVVDPVNVLGAINPLSAYQPAATSLSERFQPSTPPEPPILHLGDRRRAACSGLDFATASAGSNKVVFAVENLARATHPALQSGQ